MADLTNGSDDPLEKVYEKEMLLALKSPAGTKVTIEPGGQFELSDAPRNSLSESNESLQNYLKLLKNALAEFDGKLLFQGVQPLHGLEKLPFFKKRAIPDNVSSHAENRLPWTVDDESIIRSPGQY